MQKFNLQFNKRQNTTKSHKFHFFSFTKKNRRDKNLQECPKKLFWRLVSCCDIVGVSQCHFKSSNTKMVSPLKQKRSGHSRVHDRSSSKTFISKSNEHLLKTAINIIIKSSYYHWLNFLALHLKFGYMWHLTCGWYNN